MDRYLLSGALGALILQLFLLLAEVGIVRVGFLQKNDVRPDAQVIGTLIEKRSSVKRKASSSIVWEDSVKDDRLFSFDSILTLDHSSARISLEGDIKINLQENTLVVLEPIETNSGDPLKIRFNYGQFSSRSGRTATSRTLKVGSGDWSVEAQPGSEISLQSLENDQVQVEVHTGEVSLKKKDSTETQTLEEGTRIFLEKDKLSHREMLIDDLKFVFAENHIPGDQKVYAHHFPTRYTMKWQGQPTELRVILPDRRIEHLPINAEEKEKTLPLWPGSYTFSLIRSGETTASSDSLHVNIIPAPKIRYTFPLPRERVLYQETTPLAWFKLPDIEKYHIEVVGTPRAEMPAWQTSSPKPTTGWRPDHTGRFFWRVYGIDPDGFVIPPHYENEIFSVLNPLSAPRLHAPVKKEIQERQPADEKPQPSAFHKFLRLLWPLAHADEPRQLVFSWYPVDGADFYIIEISSTPDFMSPEINQKVMSTDFVWSGFKNQVYYWRVAAGQTNGRMGLFSETGTLDVSKLKVMKSSEIAPGVKYIPEQPKVTPAPAPAPAPVPTPAPATAAKPIPPPEPVQKIRPAPFFIEASIGAAYHFNNYKDADLTSKYQGFSRGILGISMGDGDRHSWMLHATYDLDKYRPKDENQWPYQSDQKFNPLNLRFAVAWTDSLQWTLLYTQHPLIKRDGLESVTLQTKNLGGLGLDYIFLNELEHTWRGGLAILRSSDATGFDINLQYEYMFKPDQRISPFFRKETSVEGYVGRHSQRYMDTALRLFMGFKF